MAQARSGTVPGLHRLQRFAVSDVATMGQLCWQPWGSGDAKMTAFAYDATASHAPFVRQMLHRTTEHRVGRLWANRLPALVTQLVQHCREALPLLQSYELGFAQITRQSPGSPIGKHKDPAAIGDLILTCQLTREPSNLSLAPETARELKPEAAAELRKDS